ncbi:MAG: hypothetical protein CMO19_02250 [Thaumarchaeota archaeon]|nr:hypothetical protein [Nitrososphaerota archaeon]|tara:strand:+ start:2000 stop:2803 length:804 start_codon:yes stop_codon:yes gene_type:complete
MDNLLSKRVFLLDIEGVLCESIDNEIPLSFVKEFISSLRSLNIKIAIVTNISRNPKSIVFDKLQSMGISIKSHELYTSSSTTVSIIKDNYTDPRCFVISEWGLKKDLEDSGVYVSNNDANIVVVGANRNLTYRELNHAMRLVLNGAELICSGTTQFFKGTHNSETGYFIGESAIAQAISHATGKPIRYIGKPFPEIFNQVLSDFNVNANETVMIGDTLNSDIRGANLLGITSILTTNDRNIDMTSITENDRPNYSVKNIEELYNLLF